MLKCLVSWRMALADWLVRLSCSTGWDRKYSIVVARDQSVAEKCGLFNPGTTAVHTLTGLYLPSS